MRTLVLGIDGGGTQTTCAVAAADGQELARGSGGPGNYLTAGRDGALANIAAAIQDALARAGADPEQVGAVCYGLAGAARPADHAALAPLAELVPGARWRLTHDAAIALAGATGGTPGCVIIAGTGAIAYGEDAAGRSARAGGWGWLADDLGSGFDLGRRAVMAVLQAYDGRGPATALTGRVLAHWALGEPAELIGKLYRPPIERPELAALARVVVQAAADGDAVARGIMAAGGRALADMAAAVLRRLDLAAAPAPVATAGGLFGGAGEWLLGPLRDGLGAQAPLARVQAPLADAASGAVLLARRLLPA